MPFSRGFAAGFATMDQMFANKHSRRMNEERMGLARMAEDRAQRADVRASEAHDTNQDVIRRGFERQDLADDAAAIYARAQRVGFENLSPEQLAELEGAAAFNPAIATALQEHRFDRRDVQAMSNVFGPGGGSAGGTPAQQQPRGLGAMIDGDNVHPFLASGMGDTEELPPAAPGRRRVSLGELQRQGIEVPQDLVSGPGTRAGATGGVVAGRSVEVPDNYVSMSEMADLPVVERQRVMNQNRALLGDFRTASASVVEGRQTSRQVASDWRAFLDMNSEQGDELRNLADSDPTRAVRKLHDDFNTLKKEDPNLLSSVVREMGPTVSRVVESTSEAMRNIPLNEAGMVDTSSPDFRRAHGEFNRALALQSNMSDEFNSLVRTRIRAGSMPIGNGELAQQVVADAMSTPIPGLPDSGTSTRANMGMAQRAVDQVQSGGSRRLTTRQVESLAWLAKRNYITPTGLENFLTTGSFNNQADASFFSHNPNQILFQRDAQGNIGVAYLPPDMRAGKPDRDVWTPQQIGRIDEAFAPAPGSPPRVVEEQQRQRDAFYVAVKNHSAELYGAGFDMNRLHTLGPSDIATLTARWRALQDTHNEWDGKWFRNVPVISSALQGIGLQRTSEDLNLNIVNFDDVARRMGVDPVTLPVPRANVDAALMELASSEDWVDQMMWLIGSEQDIANAIIEARQTQGPPPRRQAP